MLESSHENSREDDDLVNIHLPSQDWKTYTRLKKTSVEYLPL